MSENIHTTPSGMSINTLGLPVHMPNSEPVDTHCPFTDEYVELAAKSTKPAAPPVVIPGTSITLESAEDIAKWIEERRKRWPTRKNVELKQSLASTAVKRPAESDTQHASKKLKSVCRIFKQHGKCKFGTKCRNSHNIDSLVATKTQQRLPRKSSIPKATSALNNLNETHYTRQINGLAVLIPKLFTKRSGGDASSSSTSLFASLVKKDQFENENSLVLDFIRYLDSNNRINHNIFREKEAAELSST